jgi:hypothetical protein
MGQQQRERQATHERLSIIQLQQHNDIDNSSSPVCTFLFQLCWAALVTDWWVVASGSC